MSEICRHRALTADLSEQQTIKGNNQFTFDFFTFIRKQNFFIKYIL